MNIETKIDKSLKQKWCIRFETLHPDEDAYDGVVIYNKPDFIALFEEEDFEFDGVVIIPKKFIKKIRDGKYDKCCNEILRQNKEIEKVFSPEWIESCDNLHQIISSLKQNDIWAAIEIVFDNQTKSALYLGPITHIGAKNFRIHCYDAAGKWEKEYKLSYEEIFKIEFDSKYCNHFNRFMKSKSLNEKLPDHSTLT